MSSALHRAVVGALTHGAMAPGDPLSDTLADQSLRRRSDGAPLDALPEQWDVDTDGKPIAQPLRWLVLALAITLGAVLSALVPGPWWGPQ